MDLIAIISDIHGNLQAAEAVLDDIEARGIHRIYCLGDLVGKGPNPAEAVDLIRERCETVVQGNWDELVTRKSDPVLDWHRERLGPERLDYLAALPYSADLRLSGRHIRLYHASARGLWHRVQPTASQQERLGLFAATPLVGGADAIVPDVIGYGDVHTAFVQHLEGRTIFNPGSVGNPLDLNQASYAVLKGRLGEEAPAPFGIELVRVPYDVEAAIWAAESCGMPETALYARELRTARYRGLPD